MKKAGIAAAVAFIIASLIVVIRCKGTDVETV